MIMIDCVTALYQGMLRGPQSTLFGGLLFGSPPASKVAESPSKHIIDIFLKIWFGITACTLEDQYVSIGKFISHN